MNVFEPDPDDPLSQERAAARPRAKRRGAFFRRWMEAVRQDERDRLARERARPAADFD